MGIFPFVAVAVVAVGLILFLRSARNFEERKIKSGEWDEGGPLEPTDPPPNFYPTQLTGRRTQEVLNEISPDDTDAADDSAAPDPPPRPEMN